MTNKLLILAGIILILILGMLAAGFCLNQSRQSAEQEGKPKTQASIQWKKEVPAETRWVTARQD